MAPTTNRQGLVHKKIVPTTNRQGLVHKKWYKQQTVKVLCIKNGTNKVGLGAKQGQSFNISHTPLGFHKPLGVLIK